MAKNQYPPQLSSAYSETNLNEGANADEADAFGWVDRSSQVGRSILEAEGPLLNPVVLQGYICGRWGGALFL